ncbi:DEAD/DEAH box helicase [Filifactor villosus]|uniref:DEAD/DEAH box helicase n=1 Tax=Filifactor villosus TaxID=29374 RepID=A0ABV9QJW2_9FIRM
MKKFNEMNLSEEIITALETLGFENSTLIQELAIPIALEGRDIIGQSQTGTGKTFAFGIPILEHILQNNTKKVQALVICPTRELAVQVSGEIDKLCKFTKIKSLPVYGGEYIEKQIKSLKKNVNIVIGTPGRMMDHIKRKTLKLDSVQFVVLDEADEMLDMGFVEDIEAILNEVPEERQTMLFSATMPAEIIELSQKYLNDPEKIKVKNKTMTVDQIEQIYIKVKNSDKAEVLSRIVELEESGKSIVFCNTKKMVDELVVDMQNRGYSVEGLHGDLKQQKRDMVIERFRTGGISMLIATDVAARGLDIRDVDLVVNYDLPIEEEQYVHRIGRTGRAGASGKSYSFAYGRDVERLRRIENYAKCKIKEETIPRYERVKEKVVKQYISGINSEQSDSDLGYYLNLIEDMKESGVNLELFLANVLKKNLNFQKQERIDYRSYEREKHRTNSRERNEKKSKRHSKEKGMVRFQLNIGRMDRVLPADIVATIAGRCNISGRQIGAIDIMRDITYFDVKEEAAKNIQKKCNHILIKGKRVSAKRM